MLKKILLVLILIIVLVPLGFLSWWNKITSPVNSTNKEIKIFVIPSGLGAEKIGQKLKTEGLIKNVTAFKLMVLKEGIGKNLQAGDYRLSKSMNLYEITESLTHGTSDVKVTIPEGLRREEISNTIAKSFSDDGLEFNQAEFIKETSSLEGELFPDTYLFSKTSTVADIINTMIKNFDEKFNSLELTSNLSKKQLITLASIVEREAKFDKDRPIIAGILIKRLKKGMPLQVDASIQYAKANKLWSSSTRTDNFSWWPKDLFQEDLKIDSPYNTYLNLDLPPSPICNPGTPSLKAAANPENTDYLFYLSDKSGIMYYGRTNEEHELNKEQYLSP